MLRKGALIGLISLLLIIGIACKGASSEVFDRDRERVVVGSYIETSETKDRVAVNHQIKAQGAAKGVEVKVQNISGEDIPETLRLEILYQDEYGRDVTYPWFNTTDIDNLKAGKTITHFFPNLPKTATTYEIRIVPL